MMMRRLTNAFSKKWENLRAAYALHFAYYNFCRIHRSIRCTPAMEAGVTKRVGVKGFNEGRGVRFTEQAGAATPAACFFINALLPHYQIARGLAQLFR
jgi:hypothetical protein